MNYFEVRTIENTHVRIRKDHVSAIEEIPPTARSPGYLKLYISGYSFNVSLEFKDKVIREVGAL
jgi:hypothetical protein